MAGALCAVLAVFLSLQIVRSTLRVQTVVVATSPIRRGDVISSRNIAVQQVPGSSALSAVCATVACTEGRIAQIDISPGELITTGMSTLIPPIPAGYTTLDIRLSSATDNIVAADILDLVTPGNCSDSSKASEVCTIVHSAVVMATPVSKGNANPILLTLAMQPQDAATVLNRQEAPLIAVLRQ